MASSRDNRYSRDIGKEVARKAFQPSSGGVSNRPISRGTTISPRSTFNTSRREKNNDNRGTVFPSTSEVRNRVVNPTALSTTQIQDMIDMGFNPAKRDSSGRIVNPYGSGGLRDYISFPNLEQNQINEIYNKRVSRFLNPLDQDQTSLRRGFGSLFGSSEGEPTISGPLRKQVPDMTTTDMIARLGIGALTPFGPIVSMTDPRGTKMVPEFSNNPDNIYDPSMDPRNKDTSMLGNMLNFFTGGAGTEAGSQVRDLLPDLSTLSELLPASLFQQPTDEIDESPVANPFYPDMRRPFEYSEQTLKALGTDSEPFLY